MIADREKHPLVCRVRDLLGPDPSKPLHEFDDFSLDIRAILASANGGFFVVEGRTGKSKESHHVVKAFDSLMGRVVWSLPPERFPSYLSGGWALDPSGKRFLIGSRTKENKPFNLLEMSYMKFL